MADYTVTINRSNQIRVSQFRTGANWIDHTLVGIGDWQNPSTPRGSAATIMGQTLDLVCSHLSSFFGSYNPWRTHTDTESQMKWGSDASHPMQLDERFTVLRTKGCRIAITLGLVPFWMIESDGTYTYTYPSTGTGTNGNGTSTINVDGKDFMSTPSDYPYQGGLAANTRVADIHEDHFAELVRRFLEHMYGQYGTNVIERVQFWNEWKGYWSGSANNWDTTRFNRLYGKCWNIVQAFNAKYGLTYNAGTGWSDGNAVLMGGPYMGLTPQAANSGRPKDLAFVYPDGTYPDKRNLDATKTWFTYTQTLSTGPSGTKGTDFLCFDGANKYPDTAANWARANVSATLPIIMNEFYSDKWGSQSQAEKRAALASNLIRCVTGGLTSAYIWEPEQRTTGTGNADEYPDQALWTSTETASGQPTDTTAIFTALRQHFGPGTPIYQTTITRTSDSVVITDGSVMALASDDHVLVVNNVKDANNNGVAITVDVL